SGFEVALESVWSRSAYARIKETIKRERPEIVHFHNTFPLISPSAYYAASAAGAAVVQTLHNYRLLCPGATFFRDGAACEKCLSSPLFLPALQHGCYRNSRPATAAVAAMLGTHRALDTWNSKVDHYIALSDFAKGKYVQGSLPQDRISV